MTRFAIGSVAAVLCSFVRTILVARLVNDEHFGIAATVCDDHVAG